MRPSFARLPCARALAKAGLAAIALMIVAGCVTPGAPNAWRGTPINLVQGDGSLVKIYHRQPGAAPMDEDEVFRAVASDSSAWYEVRQAKEIRALTNSFSKKESMDSWFKRFRAETAKTPKTDLVAFLIDVHVDPYDFRTKQFAMCIEAQKSCAERQMGYALARQSDQLMPMVGDLHHLTRSTGRYVLRVELPTDRTTFTQDAEGDRSLESYFDQTRRNPLAFGIARIKNVEEDSAHGRHVINATLEAIVLKTGEFIPSQTPDYYWTNGTKLDLKL